jgi:hypothetical protein
VNAEAEGSGAEVSEVRLRLGGPTALARACHTLWRAGRNCRIVAAPAGGSPCGLALALPAPEAETAIALLAATGIHAEAMR